MKNLIKSIQSKQSLWRFLLWIAIGMIVNFTCYEAELNWYSMQFGDEVFDPGDLIFFSSMYLSIITSVSVLHSTSTVLGHSLWIVFGIGLIIVTLIHLIMFLVARRKVFYLLLVMQIFAIVGGEYCVITLKHETAPVFHVAPPKKANQPN
jgi:hypothetical protein